MKLIDGILYIEGHEFVKNKSNTSGIISIGTYKSLQSRKKIKVVSNGHGSDFFIEYETMPPAYKSLITEHYGNPYEYYAKQPILNLIKIDYEAKRFFESYEMPCGGQLSISDKIKYANDAAILRAFNQLLNNKHHLKKVLNISIGSFWKKACEVIDDVKHQYPNSLPTSDRRLKPRYNEFVNSGFDYEVLIDGRKHNETNNKIVDDALEVLLLSIYTQSHKPYKKEVHNEYLEFINGSKTVFDIKTGEVLNAQEYVKYGNLSEATVWRILNKPLNKAIADKLRLNPLDYSNKHLPYNERHAPIYSLSKLTMDDLEPPFKMADGTRVKFYEVADVASQCIIGVAHSKTKDRNLLLGSIKDMFRLLVNMNTGIPGEIEFEHHIANTFIDDLLAQGNLFPFTRLCRAANPREKRAENIFRHKRYSAAIKKEKGFQGRPFARDEANRFDEKADTKVRTYDDIVAIELNAIKKWNNAPHPKFPNMSRWQVFVNNINPNLPALKRHLIAQYIGDKTNTTIRNNKLVRVQYNNYWLNDASDITLFDNYSVTAYHIPDSEGNIDEVYLYQNDVYKCTCSKAVQYNESQFEQTENDIDIMHQQFGYRSGFDSMIRRGVERLAKISTELNSEIPEDFKIKERVSPDFIKIEEEVKQKIDYAKKAFNDL